MAKDKYHEVVKEALIKDGWTITHDPYKIEVESFNPLYIDLGAEKLLGASKGEEKIAIEIKTFLNASTITDFYRALGQFNVYDVLLEEVDPNRILFLAIPELIGKSFYKKEHVQKILKRFDVKTIVFSVKEIKILEWIK